MITKQSSPNLTRRRPPPLLCFVSPRQPPLHGRTASRAPARAPPPARPQAYDADDLPLTSVEQRAISVADLKGALEAMLVSSTHGVVGLTHVDGEAVADGSPGYIAGALQQLLLNDRQPREGSDRHVPVPYGGLTGMAVQLK